MAVYATPQPLWKRNTAGILDFVFAFLVIGALIGIVFGSDPTTANPDPSHNNVLLFHLSGWKAALLLALIVVYFIGLGRTGGTVFQRLFRMKRIR